MHQKVVSPQPQPELFPQPQPELHPHPFEELFEFPQPQVLLTHLSEVHADDVVLPISPQPQSQPHPHVFTLQLQFIIKLSPFTCMVYTMKGELSLLQFIKRFKFISHIFPFS